MKVSLTFAQPRTAINTHSGVPVLKDFQHLMQGVKFAVFLSCLFERCLLEGFILVVFSSKFPENAKFSDCFVLFLVVFVVYILSNYLTEDRRLFLIKPLKRLHNAIMLFWFVQQRPKCFDNLSTIIFLFSFLSY